jgi:polyisoprenoid-binding protein YceI
VTAEIDAASIDSKEEQRDAHLRSADFLDTALYPAITFASTSVDKVNADHFKVAGNLTIHGVTKLAVLDAEFFGRQKDPWGGERAGFSAKTSINRKEFGLTFNIPLEGGGLLVGDEVEITLDVQAVKEVSAAA